MDFFVAMPEVVHVHGKGHTKSSVKLEHRAWTSTCASCPAASLGAALNYFTGSKDHNVALRRIAIERKLKLNEYGVFRGEKAIAGKTEEDVYAALGPALHSARAAREDRRDRGGAGGQAAAT